MRILNPINYSLLLILFASYCSCNDTEIIKYIPLDSNKTFEFRKNATSNNIETKDLIRGKIPIKIDSQEIITNWVIYQSLDNQLAFSLPDNWQVKSRKKCVLYCTIEDSENGYFALVTTKKENKLSLDNYLVELYNVVSRDTTELLIDYDVKKVSLEKRLMYIFSFETKKNNINYTTYSCITEDGLNIFDFTLKKKEKNMSSLDKLKFDVVLENFKVNRNRLLAYPKDGFKVEKIEIGVN